MKYINNKKALGIKLSVSGVIAVTAYVDASYGVHMDGKSHTGVVLTLGRGPIYCKSSKQKIVTRSSTESELVGLSDSLSQVLWTKNFLLAQGYILGAAIINEDNTSTILLATKGKSVHNRTKHINIKYVYIKEKIDDGEIVIQHLPTTEMIADILTKPLQGNLFVRLRSLMMNLGE